MQESQTRNRQVKFMRVLIADDDPIALELLRNALTDDGHEVHSARDGREALQLLARSRFRF